MTKMKMILNNKIKATLSGRFFYAVCLDAKMLSSVRAKISTLRTYSGGSLPMISMIS